MARFWTDEQLKEAVITGTSLTNVIEKLGLTRTGNNAKVIKKHILRLSLNTSHFSHISPLVRKMVPELVFIENSHVKGSHVSRYTKQWSIIPYKCVECGNDGSYNGKSLTLQLDHENGVNNDNRKENLRYLCPNCHSQTPTYARKKKENLVKRYEQSLVQLICLNCNVPFKVRKSIIKSKNHSTKYCSFACSVKNRTVSNHLAIYKRYLELKNAVKTSKEFSISDRMVGKIVKKFSLLA